jgi:hypothetical protein
MKTLVLAAAMLLAIPFRSVAAATNESELKQLVKQYLPGCALQPGAKPRTLVSASGETLDLMTAGRENVQPRKGAGYWLTPTMTFLSKQQMPAGSAEEAAAVIKLLHVIEHGPSFVKQKIYFPVSVDGGWVVEVGHDSAKYPGVVPALPPYELLVDAGRHVSQIRERCYPYSVSPRIYGNTVRAVYEREMKLNGGINYSQVVLKELAKAAEAEKAQQTAKPAPAPGQRK